MNKYTIADIKKILNRAGDRSGFAFDKTAPYFANSGRLQVMRTKFSDMLELNPGKISEKQKKSINDWFATLSDRYGI